MKCFNCNQEIEQEGANNCPLCSAILNTTKNNFISYIGSPDSLFGYQKSYKLLLLKYVIEEQLEHDLAIVSSVISRIKSFYLRRKSKGLPPDYDVDNRIAQIENSSDYDVFAVIKSQPYKVINDKGFLFINRGTDDKLVFVFHEDITNSISQDEWNKLLDIINAKIGLYYNRLDETSICNEDLRLSTEAEEYISNDESNIDVQNISIYDVDGLSVRAKNILMRSGLRTVGDVIDYAEDNDLMKLRNMGEKTCNEILSYTKKISSGAIKNGVSDRISVIFSENAYRMFVGYCIRNGIEKLSDLDGFDFDILLQEPGFGVGKLKAIRNKYLSALEKREIYVVQPPKTGLKNEPIKPLINVEQSNTELDISFLRYVGISAKNTARFYQSGYAKVGQLSSITTGTIVRIFGKTSYLDELNKLRLFEKPLVSIANELLNKQKGNREFRIYIDRANKKTLQEIADSYGLTRERVRQVEKKFSKRFSPFFGALVEQHMLANNLSYILTQDVLEFFDDDEFDTVIMYALKESSSLEYLSFADMFIKKESPIQNTKLKLYALTNNLIGPDGINFFDSLPLIEEMLNDSGLDFISTDAFLDYLFEINAYFYGDFVFLKRQPYAKLCQILVGKYFPDGIRLYSDEDLNKLKEYVHTEYGQEIEFPAQNRAMSVRLSEFLISCDRGVAKTIENIHFDQSVIESIKRYIDSSELKSLYFSEIFNEFEGALAFTSDITNYHGLHGVLSYLYHDEYDFSRDMLTKKNSSASPLSLADRIVLLIKEKGRPVSKPEIKARIGGVSDMMLMTAVTGSRNLMQWDYNSFYALDNLEISNDERERLHDIIEEQFSLHKGYCSDRLAFEQVRMELPEFISRNNIENATNLFCILQSIFGECYQFSKPHICENGMLSQPTTRSIALYLLGEDKTISRSKFMQLAREVVWSEVTADLVFHDIEEDYVRISGDIYLKKDAFSIDEKVLSLVKVWLEGQLATNEYLSMTGCAEFDELPHIEYEWNAFLLVSIIKCYGLGYRLVSPAAKDRRYAKEIIVHNDSTFESLDDIVVSMLRKNNIGCIDEADLLSFLIVHHLTSKVIPKELYNSNELKYADGHFSL